MEVPFAGELVVTNLEHGKGTLIWPGVNRPGRDDYGWYCEGVVELAHAIDLVCLPEVLTIDWGKRTLRNDPRSPEQGKIVEG